MKLQLKAFLQGAFLNGSLKTELTSYLPLAQPYGVAPFNYFTTETVPSIPIDVVDWVLVELRDDADITNILFKKAAFIKNDGRIVELDGVSPLNIGGNAYGTYYIAVRHRNHLAIATATPVFLSSAVFAYDFTTAQAQAYQKAGIVNTAMKEVSAGLFAMWAGDVNKNNGVRVTGSPAINDYQNILTASAAGLPNGYYQADINMDGKVDDLDVSFIQNIVTGSGVAVIQGHL
jgi:hypothetical protein